MPTAVNLRRWHIHIQSLYRSNGTPIARHNKVLHILASKLTTLFADCHDVKVHADLQGFRSNDSPPETIPSSESPPIDLMLLSTMLVPH